MRFGFDVSRAWQHDAVQLTRTVAEIGYRAICVRLHPRILLPGSASADAALLTELRRLVDPDFTILIDTAAPHLDPADDSAQLLSIGSLNERPLEIVRAVLQAAEQFEQCTVMVRSAPAGPDPQESLDRLAGQLNLLLQESASSSVRLGLQPAAGCIVDSTARFDRLLQWLPSGAPLQLLANVASMARGGELPIVPALARHLDRLGAVILNGSRLTQPPAESASIDYRTVIHRLQQLDYDQTLLVSTPASDATLTTADIEAIYRTLVEAVER